VHRPIRFVGVGLIAAVCAATAVACSGSDDSGSTSSASSTPFIQTDPTQTVTRASDGVLRFGVLLPAQIMETAQIESVRAVLMAIVDQVNARSGFRGTPIELVIATETGNAETDQATVQTLIANSNIDALIGPSSSDIAQRINRDVTTAGVGVCSPVATSLNLSKLPDDGLMIRTVPTDATIAKAMVQLVTESGFGTASIVYPDDPYGRGLLAVLHDELAARELNVPQNDVPVEDVDIPYTVDAEGVWSTEIDIEGITNRVVLVIGDERVADDILSRVELKVVIANDGFIDVDASSIVSDNGRTFLTSLSSFEGITVDAFSGGADIVANLRDQGVDVSVSSPIPFLTNFVDCLNVMVLSALSTSSDDPRVFMAASEATTTSGSKCTRIDECINVQEQGLNFDYDGATGELDLDADGDVVNGSVLMYTFGPDGMSQPVERLRVQ
jgi:ABC-type branched-subunit amino acid transport system substrate-binding protein